MLLAMVACYLNGKVVCLLIVIVVLSIEIGSSSSVVNSNKRW